MRDAAGPGRDPEWRGGDLSPSIYFEMRSLARALLALYPQPRIAHSQSLVHEAVYKLRKYSWTYWECRKHFLMTSRLAMKQILLDRFRISPRGRHVSLDQAFNVADQDRLVIEMLLLKRALDELRKSDPSMGDVVQCKLIEGLSDPETAKRLGLSQSTVQRRFSFAKAYLKSQLASSRNGPPSCAGPNQ
jgi:RNA polymerase sigma factor (TIGR02999 family)